MYPNKLWVEVMLVRGLNDTQEALIDIASWLRKIRPDEVHVVQPTRPAAEAWVRPPQVDGLQRAHEILGEVATIVMPTVGEFEFSAEDDLVEAIVGIITRHPMKETELIESLTAWSPSNVRETLESLAESGKAQIVVREGVRFWSAAEAYYDSGNHGRNNSR